MKIKKKKLFTKIISISIILFFKNSTNGNRYIIDENKIFFKSFLAFIIIYNLL